MQSKLYQSSSKQVNPPPQLTGIAQAAAHAIDGRVVDTGVDGRSQVIRKMRCAEAAAKANAPLEPTPAWKVAVLKDLYAANNGDHCHLLLKAMRQCGEVSTLECRRWLDIPHPAGRILNLSQDGHVISRRWVRQLSERGRSHRVTAYSIAVERCNGEVA